MPSVTLERFFSDFLMRFPGGGRVLGHGPGLIAEHVGMAGHQLVVHAAGDVGQREPAGLGAQEGVEVDLEEQVAELLLEMRHRLFLDGGRGRTVELSTAAISSIASSTS